MEQGLKRLANWMAGGACVVLIFIMLVTFVDVIGRFFLNSPLTFAVELVELGMGLLIMLGLAITTLNRGHIAVDLLGSALPEFGQKILAWLAALAGLIFIILMAWRLWDKGIRFMGDGLATQVLYLPVFPVVLVMASAAAVAVFIAAIQLILPDPNNSGN